MKKDIRNADIIIYKLGLVLIREINYRLKIIKKRAKKNKIIEKRKMKTKN